MALTTIVDDDGEEQQIVRYNDFSTAVTGTLFYVPSLDFLDDPRAAAEAPSNDDSLGIGSLRDSS